MSNEHLQNLIEQADAFGRNGGDVGDHTRDEVLKQDLIREIIYANAGAMSVGTELIPTRQMTSKSIQFEYPGSTTAEYPVAPDTLADRQRFTWKEFKMRLQRAQTRYFISDDAKLSGMADIQAQRAATEASRALAMRKDENILGTLLGGAYDENESDASGHWNTPGTGGIDEDELIDDLWAMWEEILVNTPLETAETGTLAVVLPVRVYTQLNRLKLINNIQQRTEDYLSQTFNFQFYPTKLHMHEDNQLEEQYDVSTEDTALMVMTGENTAVHGELSEQFASSVGVPLTEGPNREFGLGEDYLITQWYNTGIMEHETGKEGETPRIAVRHGVNYHADPEFHN